MFSRDALYRSGTAPWDIGRPQAAIARITEEGRIRGRVLDVGCGTAEHTLLFAARGHEAWGVDLEPAAIERARAKAEARSIDVTLRVHDALDLAALGTTFDTIVDSGLFHTFADELRIRYARSVASVLAADGAFYLLCFSEHEPGDWGPRRIRRDAIETTFAEVGLGVVAIQAVAFERRRDDGDDAAGWLAEIRRR